MSQPDRRYLLPDVQAALPPLYLPVPMREREFTFKRVLLHILLFLLTCITTAAAGAILPRILFENVDLTFAAIGTVIVAHILDPRSIAFAFTLLTILGMHELGHYFACRYYRVRATMPYFIPFLPVIGIGTLGAFIKIKEPIRSRRALFDIGIAGPIAGFVFAVPAAVLGLLMAHPQVGAPQIIFNDPLLFVVIKWIFGLHGRYHWNPVWFAAWVGMIATSLNLLPVGQLDGGHITYALFGKRVHKIIGVSIFVSMVVVAVTGWFFHHWAGGVLYAVLLIVMLFAKHPPTADPFEKIGALRIFVAILGLLIFILSVMPFPMSIG
ncbi:MAG TPA: site-2 protease family protein [Blastocatellia bacterium]|nr:site-2 protease family protein [Blastocatellia bacterium]